MMQLTMKVLEGENSNNISRFVGEQQPIFDALEKIENDWPGVQQWNVWFNDTIFGRYRNLAELHKMEAEVAEEESDEHMDATAHSEAIEVAALSGEEFLTELDELLTDDIPLESIVSPVEQRSVVTPEQDDEARPSLPLIDITVRS